MVNIGSDIEISVLELAQKIISICNSKSKIVHLPPLKEGDMTRRKPDATKMRELLVHDLTPLDTGIKYLVEHYRSKREMTEAE